MRILIINYEFPPLGGGAGKASYHIAENLSEMGHRIAVLTSSFRGLKRRECVQGMEVFRVPVIRKRIDRCSVPEMLTFIISATVNSGKIIKKFRPEKIIAFFGIPSGPVALWIKHRFKIPYILSLRGGDVPGFLGESLGMYHAISSPLLYSIWRNADKIVTNSRRLKSLAKGFAPGLKISIIPNGFDRVNHEPKRDKRNKKDVRILTAGRLSHQKGIEYLLKALPALEKKWSRKDYRIEIVGDGPLRKTLEEMAIHLSIDGKITFSGWVSQEELSQKYRQSDLFVLPSLDEGMPNVILEAMAHGLPIITTTILKGDDLVRDGYNGFLVSPRDTIELMKKMVYLIEDEQKRKDMGEKSLQVLKDIPCWKDVASQYLDHLLPMSISSIDKGSDTLPLLEASVKI